jgi:uncharacterized protein YdeI (YjbR/CyaY-like superfamily)
VTIQDHSWESTVAVMGGRFMVGVPAEHRAAAGVTAGDTLTVTLELDDAPRTVAVPRDLVEALAASDATAAFEQLAPSRRKEHVRSVEDAKTPETRARRIAKVIEALS